MFFLLLFFLIISTMVNPSVIKLMLPTSSSSQTINKKPINLLVSADKKYYIENREVPFQTLENELAAQVAKSPDLTVLLRVDNGLTVQDLVDILTVGNKLKLKMVLATKSAQQ